MRTALVTGGSQRVGRAFTLALADKGYAVAVHYNSSAAAAENLAAEIRDRGGQAAAIGANLSDANETEALIGKTADALSPPVLLLNSASTFRFDRATDFTPNTWHAQMAVNLLAPAILAREFAATLPGDQEGCIINIIDQKVENPSPEFFSYTISKAALATLTRVNAQALAPRIRVCGVAPGLTLPSGAQTKEQFEEVHGQTLLGRGSTTEALVDAVLYLVGADRVTGQILYVDGGERFVSGRDYEDMIEKEDQQ